MWTSLTVALEANRLAANQMIGKFLAAKQSLSVRNLKEILKKPKDATTAQGENSAEQSAPYRGCAAQIKPFLLKPFFHR